MPPFAIFGIRKQGDGAMSAETDLRLGELAHRVARAQAPAHELVSEFISATRDGSGRAHSAASARINTLVEAKAWTEATLALVDLALPQWRLSRLIYEDGCWFCSLSKQWNLPEWLADRAESRHDSLPLAILGAMIEAHHCSEKPFEQAKGSVPKCPLESDPLRAAVSCDNFA
jgi:hypothetical protein